MGGESERWRQTSIKLLDLFPPRRRKPAPSLWADVLPTLTGVALCAGTVVLALMMFRILCGSTGP